jgi:GNAT superfamily N-acetyltransferase
MEKQTNPAAAADVGVRDALASDAPGLARLAEQLGYPTEPSVIADRLREIDPQLERVIVAVHDAHGVVAWLTVRATVHIHSGPHAEISGFVVDETMRGVGIGKRLMTEVEQWARTKGLPAIHLSTNVKRTDAHRFYESLGFRVTKQQYALTKELHP